MFILGDDGTLDTIIYCPDCDEEQRYNYQYEEMEPYTNRFGVEVEAPDSERTRRYDEFVTELLRDANSEHECI